MSDPSIITIQEQIEFCDRMAITTLRHGDRDISEMYQAIGENLRKQAASDELADSFFKYFRSLHDKQREKQNEHDYHRAYHATKEPMDEKADQDGQHGPGHGDRDRQPQKEERP